HACIVWTNVVATAATVAIGQRAAYAATTDLPAGARFALSAVADWRIVRTHGATGAAVVAVTEKRPADAVAIRLSSRTCLARAVDAERGTTGARVAARAAVRRIGQKISATPGTRRKSIAAG